MKTFFWLFERYPDAKAALRELLEAGIDAEEVNAMIAVKTAKEVMDVNWEKADVHVTDEIGKQRLTGLDALLAREQPVSTPDADEIYAAGKVATIAGKTASSAMREPHGLLGALEDLNVPEPAARAFVEGLGRGGVLLWVRAEDELAVSISDTLQGQQADISASYTLG